VNDLTLNFKEIVSRDYKGVLMIPWHRWGCAVIPLEVLKFLKIKLSVLHFKKPSLSCVRSFAVTPPGSHTLQCNIFKAMVDKKFCDVKFRKNLQNIALVQNFVKYLQNSTEILNSKLCDSEQFSRIPVKCHHGASIVLERTYDERIF
jgi:hypothetical protein